MTNPSNLLRRHRSACLGLVLMGLANFSMADTPIIQPGAPGTEARELSAEEAIEIADTSYSPDDVKFMQDMIPHHHQALQSAGMHWPEP